MKAKFLAVVALAGVCSSSSVTFARSPESRPPSSVVGYTVTEVETVTYEPEASRRWTTANGLHQITVVGGTLSVEGADRERRLYRAGEAFVAGWETYTATNPTAAPVEVVVASLRPTIG